MLDELPIVDFLSIGLARYVHDAMMNKKIKNDTPTDILIEQIE